MRNNSLIFISLIVLTFLAVSGCGKSGSSGSAPCTDLPPTADSTALLNFASTHGITNLKDTLGVYYQVLSQGSGATPTGKSTIFITYKGTFMNGVVFDSTNDASKTGWELDGLIPGWQIGIPKIQAGGHIKLLIPSVYAYGCQGYGAAIPANSPMYFDINLVSVQ